MRGKIHTEQNEKGSFDYSFVEIPIKCLHNDDECQPRTVKSSHVWSIYNDLRRNPTHEHPGCRIVPNDDRNFPGTYKILLFETLRLDI